MGYFRIVQNNCTVQLYKNVIVKGLVMDSNLRYRLSPTLSQQPLHSVVISHCPNPVHNEPSVSRPHLCTGKPLQPSNVTIEMDDCIVSNGEVSTTKMKSDFDADNVPVSVSEEEEAQME